MTALFVEVVAILKYELYNMLLVVCVINSDLKLKNICYNITPVVVYHFILSPRLNSIEDIPMLVN